MQIKKIISGLEAIKFGTASSDGAKVIDEAIKTILDLNLQCEQFESEQIILKDEKSYLSECYDAERKNVFAAKQKMITLSKELQKIKVEYNKALNTLAAHGISIEGSI